MNGLMTKKEVARLEALLMVSKYTKNKNGISFRGETASYSKTIHTNMGGNLYELTCFLYDVEKDKERTTGAEWSIINLYPNMSIDRLEISVVDETMNPTQVEEIARIIHRALRNDYLMEKIG